MKAASQTMQNRILPITTPTRQSAIWRRNLFTLLGAVLIADAWGAIVQTQFNIASLQAIGGEIGFQLRLQMTALDLLGFTPIYGVIVLLGLSCALPVAAVLAGRWPLWRAPLYAFAGMAGIATAIRIVDIATPAPTLIAATRGSAGWLLMALGGVFAGWWFARRTLHR
jgi:hypothetical protein